SLARWRNAASSAKRLFSSAKKRARAPSAPRVLARPGAAPGSTIRQILGKGAQARAHSLRALFSLHGLQQLVVKALVAQQYRTSAAHARDRRIDIARRGKQQILHHVGVITQGDATEAGLQYAHVGLTTGEDDLALVCTA